MYTKIIEIKRMFCAKSTKPLSLFFREYRKDVFLSFGGVICVRRQMYKVYKKIYGAF